MQSCSEKLFHYFSNETFYEGKKLLTVEHIFEFQVHTKQNVCHKFERHMTVLRYIQR